MIVHSQRNGPTTLQDSMLNTLHFDSNVNLDFKTYLRCLLKHKEHTNCNLEVIP